jgi:hypothetical protein
LNEITEGDNVIIKINDTVRDNVDFVVLSNRALTYIKPDTKEILQFVKIGGCEYFH